MPGSLAAVLASDSASRESLWAIRPTSAWLALRDHLLFHSCLPTCPRTASRFPETNRQIIASNASSSDSILLEWTSGRAEAKFPAERSFLISEKLWESMAIGVVFNPRACPADPGRRKEDEVFSGKDQPIPRRKHVPWLRSNPAW